MNRFKVGDKVRYVSYPSNYLEEGKVYTVTGITSHGVKLEGFDSNQWWNESTFEAVSRDTEEHKLTVPSIHCVDWHRMYEEAMEDGRDMAVITMSNTKDVVICISRKLSNKACFIADLGIAQDLAILGVYTGFGSPINCPIEAVGHVRELLKKVKEASWINKEEVTLEVKQVQV